jgi:nicotinamide-nucleotide amidase
MTARAPRVRLLSIGTEILQGLYADTNAQWLSARLLDAGFDVLGHQAVGDDEAAIAEAIAAARARAELVLVTGGLGPTEDDLTRSAIARATGRPLAEDPDALEHIRARFALRGIPMPAGNAVQALLPAGALRLDNPNGTAPGFLIAAEPGHACIAAMPGVPREMKPMMEALLAGPLAEAFAARPVRHVRTLHIALRAESELNDMLRDLFAADARVAVTILARLGMVRFRLTGTAPTLEEARAAVDALAAEARRRVGDASIFADGPADATLAEALVAAARERGRTVATAESCTGGMIASRITDVPGSSAVFRAGFVAYGNESKARDLGVLPQVFVQHGAVSEACALAMAEGARFRAKADVAVAVTGIAGPDGGSEAKPVGTVWIAVAAAKGTEAHHRRFLGTRDMVREWATAHALELARRAVLA